MKVIIDFDEYKPWSGAKDTYEKIEEAGMLDQLESYLEEIFEGEATATQINDVLWFEGDDVLGYLGLLDEDDMDESLNEGINKMKLKEDAFDSILKPEHGVMSEEPPMADAKIIHDRNKEIYKDSMNNKVADEMIEQQKAEEDKRYTKEVKAMFHLNESLFNESASGENSNKMYDLIDELGDEFGKQVAEAAIRWMSDDEVGEFARANEFFYEDDDDETITEGRKKLADTHHLIRLVDDDKEDYDMQGFLIDLLCKNKSNYAPKAPYDFKSFAYLTDDEYNKSYLTIYREKFAGIGKHESGLYKDGDIMLVSNDEKQFVNVIKILDDWDIQHSDVKYDNWEYTMMIVVPDDSGMPMNAFDYFTEIGVDPITVVKKQPKDSYELNAEA